MNYSSEGAAAEKAASVAAAASASLRMIIAAHPFLKDMRPEHLEILADCAMRTTFEAEQVIFREGELANRFYLIQDGKVALEAPVREGEPMAIQTLGAGDVLGWSWLFPPCYWRFDAKALERTEAIFFYGTRLREQCEDDHDLGFELLKRMAGVVLQRLQATRRQLLDLRTSAKGFP